MGVSGLKGFFLRDRDFKTCFLKNIPEEISSLFIDANGIFYAAAAKVYLNSSNNGEFIHPESERKKLLKKNRKKLEIFHFETIVEILKKIINLVKPKDNLIIAVDGTVNAAKMNQQKSRRFKGSLEEDPYQIFEGSPSVSPGTEFMTKIDEYLEKWLRHYKGYLPKNTIYSSHLSPGEGEHKIFDYIRRGDIIKGKGYHVVSGLDNDLIFLSTVSPLKNIILRPDDGSGPLDVEKFKAMVISKMKYPGSDKETIIRDFLLIGTLLGNDFLQKFPNTSFYINKTLPILFNCYTWNKKKLTDKNNNIIWKNYLTFLEIYNNFKSTTSSLYVQAYLNGPKIKYKELENNIIVKDKEGNKVSQVYDPTKHVLDFDYENFKKDWYSKQFNENVLQWNGDIVSTYDKRMIQTMCLNYLKMVQWVQYLYTLGYKKVDNILFYHYTYNPLLGDVIIVLNNLILKDKTSILENVKNKKQQMKISTIHHLLSVIPEKNINNIPEEFRYLYPKYLKILNPSSFDLLRENYSKEYQILPNLPHINLEYIDKILEKEGFDLSEYMKEKKDLKITKDEDQDFSISHNDLI